MKPNQLITTMLAATALFVASCSTPQMAQNNAIQDDVYNTTAKAREYTPQPIAQNLPSENLDDPYYIESDPRYDMDYSSRIDRFYYGNLNRGYYDPFYNYYGYNNWGFNNIGFNNWGFNNWGFNNWGFNNWGFNNFGFNNWGFHGGLGFDPYWGYYSNFNQFGTGFYGGGLGWGGFYGGGVIAGINNENYRPRPTRGVDRNQDVRNRSDFGRNNNGLSGSRPTRYNPSSNNGISGRNSGTSMQRPERNNNGNNSGQQQSRPTRNDAPSRPAPNYSPPTQQNSPPPASNRGTETSRPTRSGGRG